MGEIILKKVSADRDYFKEITKGRLHDQIKCLPIDMAELTEKDLRLMLKPGKVEWSLRSSFWNEINRMYLEERECIIQENVYGGICSINQWHKRLDDKYFVAFMLCPVRHYEAEIEALLARGVDRYWDIIEMDINVIDRYGKRHEGNIDPRKAKLVLDTMKEITDRAKGLALQRIETTGRVTIKPAKPLSMEKIDEKIKLLESQLESGVIDAEIQNEETED